MINTDRKVIGIGESVWDIIVQNNQPQKAVPGGSTFNCMVSLGRCDVPSVFISELGDDKIGFIIRSFLEENNLSGEYIDFNPNAQTSVSVAFLDENQDAEYLFYRDFPVKNRLNIPFPTINENDVVVFGSYFSVNPVIRKRVFNFLQYAKKQKAILYYDINIRKPHITEDRTRLDRYIIGNYKFSDVIRCSEEDLKLIYPGKSLDDIIYLLFQFCPCVIVTRGSQEILLTTPHFQKKHKVEAIQPVSTIGAGDNFNAGFIYGMMKLFICRNDLNLMSERSWEDLLRYGKLFAREVCLSMDNYVSKAFAEEHKFVSPK